jgi:STIP1 family protein 1
MYSTANLTDKEIKEQGNRLFSLHKYEDAANCYTKAIVSNILDNKVLDVFIYYYYWLQNLQIKNPNEAFHFTNRALAYLKLKRWESSCQDCRRALDLDPCHIKGHFYLGMALQGLELFDEAIKHFQRGI